MLETNELKNNFTLMLKQKLVSSDIIRDFSFYEIEDQQKSLLGIVLADDAHPQEFIELLSQFKISVQDANTLEFIFVSHLPYDQNGHVSWEHLVNLSYISLNDLKHIDLENKEVFDCSRSLTIVQQHLLKSPLIKLDEIIKSPLPFYKNHEQHKIDTKSISTNSAKNEAIIHGQKIEDNFLTAQTLQDCLDQAKSDKSKGVKYIDLDGSLESISYAELKEDALIILKGLQNSGLKKGEFLIFQFNNSISYLKTFWACVYGGFIPAPVAMPDHYEDRSSALEKLIKVKELLTDAYVVTDRYYDLFTFYQKENWKHGPLNFEELIQQNQKGEITSLSPQDGALILFTSGSTGIPKGVLLSHQNILSMSAGTIQINKLTSSDVTLNWMPLDHVGAIVFLSCLAVDLGTNQIHVPTDYILEEPLRWLDLIQEHRATMSWAPNFAFALINDRQEEIQQKEWDLSSMHFLVNAGEQISSKSARNFLEVLAMHQLPSDAIVPAFGMSETCSGISWSLKFSAEGGDIDNFVSLGPPIPGSSFRIVDDQKNILSEGSIGNFELKGPSLFAGYYKRDDLNKQVFLDDGWFHTGDLGFLKDGNLYLTGRNKDDIIINGVNFFSHEIEQVLEEIPEIEVSYVAACPVKLINDESEKLAIFLHPSKGQFSTLLQRKVQAHLLDKLGLISDFVVSLAKEDFPKTGIGKIQKSKLRAKFEKGDYVEILKRQGHSIDFPNIIEKEYFHPGWVKRRLPETNDITTTHKTVFLFHLFENQLINTEFEKVNLIHCLEGNEFKQSSSDTYRIDFSKEDQLRELFKLKHQKSLSSEIVFNVEGVSNFILDSFFDKLFISANLIKNKIQGIRFVGQKGNIPTNLLSMTYLKKFEALTGKSLVQVLQLSDQYHCKDLDLDLEFSSKIVCPNVSYSSKGRQELLLKPYQELSAIQFSSPFFTSTFRINQLENTVVILSGNETGLINTFSAYLKNNLNLIVVYCDLHKNGSSINKKYIDIFINSESDWDQYKIENENKFHQFEIYHCEEIKAWNPTPIEGSKIYQIYSYDMLCGHSSLHQYNAENSYQLFIDTKFEIDTLDRDLAEVIYFLEQEEHHLVSTSINNACKFGVFAHPVRTSFRLKSYLQSDKIESLDDFIRKSIVGHSLSITAEIIKDYPVDYKGSIDFKSLAKGKLNRKSASLGASAIAKKVEKVWISVLNIEEAAHDETFFDLGGHSLLIAKTQGLLEKELDRKITILELFKFPTIGEFSKYIQESSEDRIGSHSYGLSRAKVRNEIHQKIALTDIAVVGMACRFPGANDVETFWENLKEGKESISFFTEEEAKEAGVNPEWYGKDQYVFAAPVIEDVDMFDPEFFGITGRDADLMDPQQRVAIEVAWETLERAGYNPKSYDGSIGVYAGAGMNTYLINNILPNKNNLTTKNSLDVYNLDSLGGFQIMITNDKDYISTRISYCLDLKGPSVNVQTACSTSLVAVHMASQSIISGESDMALAGGVSVKVPQKSGYSHSEGMIVAADGHCKAFDEKADGTIFGSGCGFVLLKRLDKALEDGDHIHTIIKGTSFNNDGGSKIGFAAPSEFGESSAIAEAITIAGVPADTIGYVETHGTGTELGDPIEVSSLTSAFRETTNKKGYCPIGSVKSNVGHLQIASGIVGFIKTALSVENGLVPPSLHFNTPNPKIQFSSSPFYVNTKLSKWNLSGPRRAGVNSLGIGGANTHAILEEADCHLKQFQRKTSNEEFGLLTISARNEKALKELVQNYINFLSNTKEDFRDICFTSNVGRVHFDFRIALLGKSKEEIITQLKDHIVKKDVRKIKKIAFVFSGQGSQYVAMAKSLYLSDVSFQSDFDLCDRFCLPYLKRSMKELLLEGTEIDLAETSITQPILFSLEVCLAKYWIRLGIEPQYLMGHSLGEYSAACIANVFSLEDGLKLVLMRSQLMSSLPSGGGMLAVATDEKALSEIIDFNKVSIAAVNSKNSLVLSGDLNTLKTLSEKIKANQIKCTFLEVSHAFHSKLMDPILGEYRDFLDEIDFNLPRYELISNVTGKPEVDAFADRQYWVDHISESVLFSKSVEQLIEEKMDAIIEIGPQATLLGLIKSNLSDNMNSNLLLVSSLRKNSDSHEHILNTLGSLYEAGQDFNWVELHINHIRKRVILPTYAFQKSSHWIDAPKPSDLSNNHLVDLNLPESKRILGRRTDSPVLKSSIYNIDLSVKTLSYVKEHKVFDAIVVPGAGHISMLLEICKDQFGNGAYCLEDVIFNAVLIVDPKKNTEIQLSLNKSDENQFSFELISDLDQENFRSHCFGKLKQSNQQTPKAVNLLKLKELINKPISRDDFYAGFDKRKIELGSTFRWVNELWANEKESLAKMKVPSSYDAEQQWMIHPGLLDSSIQILMASIDLNFDETLIPFSIDSYEYFGANYTTEIYSHFEKTAESTDGMITGDITMLNGNGDVIAKVSGFKVRKINQEIVSKEINKHKTISAYTFDSKIIELKNLKVAKKENVRALIISDKSDNDLRAFYDSEINEVTYLLPSDVSAHDFSTNQFDEAIFYPTSEIKSLEDLYQSIDQIRTTIQIILKKECLTAGATISFIIDHNDTNELSEPLAKMIEAFARVIQLEHPALKTKCLTLNDLMGTASQRTLNKLMPLSIDQVPSKVFDPKGIYLITGAFGGLGQKTIEALVEEGVSEFILISRSKHTIESLDNYEQYISNGITFKILTVDVADKNSLTTGLNTDLTKIKGIFHCAGIVEDSLITESDWKSFENVYQSKIAGTYNLHHISQQISSLNYFVTYSSISSIFGAVSQAAYGSANAFMDNLMKLRSQKGLPGLSINWGPWAEIGMAAKLSDSEQLFWQNKGFKFLDAEVCKKSLVSLLHKSSEHLPSQVLLAEVNWSQLAKSMDSSLFKDLITESIEENDFDICQAIESADIVDRYELLNNYIQGIVATVLGIKNPKDIDSTKGLSDLGLDSLASVELKGRLEAGLKVALKVTLVFDYPTLDKLIAHIASDILSYEFDEAENDISVVDESEEELEEEDIASALERQLAELEDEDED
ncbi:MAG: hypothetical protein COA79_18065 [Planctomycetota bacterium]|nr:MAG: hypothetical protein COA79_18065 [Planctomycetota bacterium]